MAIQSSCPPSRVRLFRSDRLEKLTVISPRGFAFTWIIVLSLAVFAGWGTASAMVSIGLVVLGTLIWTLYEYAMHRFVFHLKARSDFFRKIVFLMHGNHHVVPGDADRNLMPPVVSLSILGTFWATFVLLIGAAGSVLFVGFAIGYVIYDSVHYACHQFRMRGPVLRHLQRHHIRHHYAKQDGNYAITAIPWDRVFGTRIAITRR